MAGPPQGAGAIVVPPNRHALDTRLRVLGAMIGATLFFSIIGLTLPLVEAKAAATGTVVDLGEASAWTMNMNAAAFGRIGTGDEEDTNTTKGVATHFLTQGTRHRKTAEHILKGHVFCSAGLQGLCDSIVHVSRTLIKVQGMMVPACSVLLGSLAALPLTSMRTRNQARVVTSMAVLSFILHIAAASYLAAHATDDTERVFRHTFPATPISVDLASGAVWLFIATFLSFTTMAYGALVSVQTTNDPYPLGDGPNYDENNPMPWHFLPIEHRKPLTSAIRPTEPIAEVDSTAAPLQ